MHAIKYQKLAAEWKDYLKLVSPTAIWTRIYFGWAVTINGKCILVKFKTMRHCLLIFELKFANIIRLLFLMASLWLWIVRAQHCHTHKTKIAQNFFSVRCCKALMKSHNWNLIQEKTQVDYHHWFEFTLLKLTLAVYGAQQCVEGRVQPFQALSV